MTDPINPGPDPTMREWAGMKHEWYMDAKGMRITKTGSIRWG